MPKTYEQILKQIDTLQQQAEKLRQQELSGVISRIQVAIKAYGLTAADLGFAAANTPRAAAGASPAAPGVVKVKRRRRGKAQIKASKSSAPLKYRNEAGQGWVGMGKRPQWLRDALAAGKTLADFRI
jgi:DNA-binding protein H-NS